MMKLDHVQLAVPRDCEDNCHAFRSGLPGFDNLEKPEASCPRGGVWFSSGATEIYPSGNRPEFVAEPE